MDPKRLKQLKHPMVRQAVAEFLLSLIDPSDPSTQQSFRDWGATGDSRLGSDQALQNEIRWLRMFAVDLNVSQMLGETPAKCAILDSFYRALSKAGYVDANYLERAAAYTEALKGAGPPDPALAVGRTFGRFLGAPSDPDGAMRGKIQFMALSITLSEFFVRATKPERT